MLELIILIALIIIILIFLIYKDKYKTSIDVNSEGFVTQDNYYLSSCPSGFNSYYDNNGNIMCCNGEVIANKCISDTNCSLTSANNPDSCVAILLEQYNQQAQQYCPLQSMPNYYNNKTSNKKGCTNGLLNSSMDGPANTSQPQCTIYSDTNTNSISTDSCLNQKRLDAAQCFGNNCTKSLISPGSGLPILIGISFTDNNGMPHMAFTQESFEDALNVINPNWRDSFDISKNIQIAEVAKAYYIDRTLQQSDIQF